MEVPPTGSGALAGTVTWDDDDGSSISIPLNAPEIAEIEKIKLRWSGTLSGGTLTASVALHVLASSTGSDAVSTGTSTTGHTTTFTLTDETITLSDDANLDHSSKSGHLIISELKEANVPVLIGPTFCSRPKIETREKTFRTPGILARAGLEVSIISDHGVIPIQYLLIYAAMAVREGMPEDAALLAVTRNPARALDVADRVGSLEPGKDGDVVVFDRHPLDFKATPLRVFVNGELAHSAEE